MKETTKQIGDFGEDIAEKHLKKRFWRIISRNFKAHGGEIDIIVRDRKYLVFAEVKCRKKGSIVAASEAVDIIKQQRIIHTAQMFIAASGGQYSELQPRFDVITLEQNKEGQIKFAEHIKNAFTL